jgi:hypothetical protein
MTVTEQIRFKLSIINFLISNRFENLFKKKHHEELERIKDISEVFDHVNKFTVPKRFIFETANFKFIVSEFIKSKDVEEKNRRSLSHLSCLLEDVLELMEEIEE